MTKTTKREGFNKRIENIKFSTNYNAGLWLDKFIYDAKKEAKGNSSDDETAKAELVRRVTSIAEPDFYKNYFENTWNQNLHSFGAKCRKAKVKM